MVNRLVLFCMPCLFAVLFVSSALSGEATDLAIIRKVNPVTILKPQEVIRFNPWETSELKLAATGLIRLYQKFISSQDSPRVQLSTDVFSLRYGVHTGVWCSTRDTADC